MKILIADKLSPEGAAWLRSQANTEVTIQTGLAGEALAQAIAGHDGVVVRSEVQVTGDVLNRAMTGGGASRPRLKAIARAGVGVDNIDLEAATRLGVAVMNSASASTITTAEHAFALLLALARNIGPAYVTMKNGGWDRTKYTGMQLHGKTLGVVGMGRIGQAVARRARAFGMTIIGYDPMANSTTALDGTTPLTSTLDDLLLQADAITFHVPKTKETTGMLGAAQFARCKKGLLVVNAARGGIVDEAALIPALDAGQCGGAALDVFDVEPLPADSPLRKHPKILITPHLGASTVEAQEAVALDACKAVLAYLNGEGGEGTLNTGGLRMDLTERQRAFVDLAERMAALVDAITGTKGAKGLRSVKFIARGGLLAPRYETVARYALAALLQSRSERPVSVINAEIVADDLKINVETRLATEQGEDRLLIELTDGQGEAHRVEGAMYADGQPRITNLDGYTMDMVARGHIVLLVNADIPGRIGVVGQHFGEAKANIAEMVIGRRDPGAGVVAGPPVAMMIVKLDAPPQQGVIESLRKKEGILQVATVEL